MPRKWAPVRFERTFSPQEYERLALGFIPRQLEDKWFVYLEEDWMYFHRSWTGHCIYRVRLEEEGDHYRVREAWVNRDADQRWKSQFSASLERSGQLDAYEAQQLEELFGLLLSLGLSGYGESWHSR